MTAKLEQGQSLEEWAKFQGDLNNLGDRNTASDPFVKVLEMFKVFEDQHPKVKGNQKMDLFYRETYQYFK